MGNSGLGEEAIARVEAEIAGRSGMTDEETRVRVGRDQENHRSRSQTAALQALAMKGDRVVSGFATQTR